MAEKNYAQQRASILENLDGLRVDVDAEKRIGYLILDREPLNIVSYTGRQQIRAIIEEMDEDDDVGVIVIKGAEHNHILCPRRPHRRPDAGKGYGYARHPYPSAQGPRMGDC